MPIVAQVDFSFVDQLLGSLAELGADIGRFIPRLIAALLLLWVGNWLAKFLRKWIVRGLEKIGAGRLTSAAGLDPILEQATTNGVTLIGQVIYFLIMLIFVQIAAEVLGIDQITALLSGLIAYLPLVVVALLVLFIAAAIANWAARTVQPFADSRGVSWVGTVVRVAILVVGVLAALDTLNFAPSVTAKVENTLLQWLPISVLLAAAVSFGIGGIDTAKEWWRKLAPKGSPTRGDV